MLFMTYGANYKMGHLVGNYIPYGYVIFKINKYLITFLIGGRTLKAIGGPRYFQQEVFLPRILLVP